MQRAATKQRHRRNGFTLIELMAVLVVIVVLGGIAVSVAKHASQRATAARTKAEIATLETALEHFKSDHGFYPAWTNAGVWNSTNLYNFLSGSNALNGTTTFQATKPYYQFTSSQMRPGVSYYWTNLLTSQIVSNWVTAVVDPFNNEYQYRYPGSNNAAGFDLWSVGADGVTGTGKNRLGVTANLDDIANWK